MSQVLFVTLWHICKVKNKQFEQIMLNIFPIQKKIVIWKFPLLFNEKRKKNTPKSLPLLFKGFMR